MLNVSVDIKVSKMLITKYKMCFPKTAELLQFLFCLLETHILLNLK